MRPPDRRPVEREPQAPALRFDRVGHSYGPNQEVLSDATFDLRPGSLTFLTGPSGAGKSTLLRIAYLALRPSSGRVSLFGVATSGLARRDAPALRRRIGVVFQDFRLLDHLTAFENVALPLRIAGEKEESYRQNVAELLAWVGLGERLEARPPSLSGGEKQRVAIARAVVARPDLIIADEPTGNIDEEMGERLLRLFLELNRNLRTTILIATHDMSLLRQSGAEHLRIANGVVMRAPVPAPRPSAGGGAT